MPADRILTDPCVLFALRRESMYFRRSFPFQQRFPSAPCPARFHGTPAQRVLMLETGMGAAAMETALRWCLQEPRLGAAIYRPRFIISAGFSGALQADQHVGDLILATEIVDERANCWPMHAPEAWTTENCRRGRLLTASELVADPNEKRRLGEHYDAVAVDMETAIIARLCQEHSLPLICLRVISDDVRTPLSPQLAELLRGGRVSPSRLGWTILRRPALIAELCRLARQTRKAARRLLPLGSLLAVLDRSPPSRAIRMEPVPPSGRWRSSCAPCPWPP